MNRLLLVMLLVLPVLLCAQYDERQIMLQRAQGLEMRQMYEQANDIYEELARQYPGDVNVIDRWVRNLLRLSQEDKAAEVLQANREHLPERQWTQLMLQVQLKLGDVKAAHDTAWDFLGRYPGDQAAYQEFANVFSGYYQPEEAVRLYNAARKQADDDKLYALQLARAYQQARKLELALDEYVLHLRGNSGYLHYIASQVRAILDEDRRQLGHLESLCGAGQPEPLRELLAQAYVHLGEMDRAFGVYETLEPVKLKRFADEQYAANELGTALRAYRAYLVRETRPPMQAEAQVAVARVYSSMGMPDSTRAVLLRIYHDEELQSPRMRGSSRANQVCREMLSDLALSDGDYAAAERYLQEAMQYTVHPKERELSELNLLRLVVLLQRYDEADTRLRQLAESDDPKLENGVTYLQWMSYWLQDDSYADSLLNTMMIRDPGRESVNDALMLTLLCIDEDKQTGTIREAVRLHGLRQYTDAAEVLLRTDSPMLALLAGDWALEAHDERLATLIFSRQWSDPDLAAQAALRLAQLDSGQSRQERVTTFLNRQPTHPFSPLFRLLLRGQGAVQP